MMSRFARTALRPRRRPRFAASPRRARPGFVGERPAAWPRLSLHGRVRPCRSEWYPYGRRARPPFLPPSAMILNAYAVLDAFVTLLRLCVGLGVLGLGAAAWLTYVPPRSPEAEQALQNRYYLLFQAAGLLL